VVVRSALAVDLRVDGPAHDAFVQREIQPQPVEPRSPVLAGGPQYTIDLCKQRFLLCLQVGDQFSSDGCASSPRCGLTTTGVGTVVDDRTAQAVIRPAHGLGGPNHGTDCSGGVRLVQQLGSQVIENAAQDPGHLHL
jgi:hypothetical protein